MVSTGCSNHEKLLFKRQNCYFINKLIVDLSPTSGSEPTFKSNNYNFPDVAERKLDRNSLDVDQFERE